MSERAVVAELEAIGATPKVVRFVISEIIGNVVPLSVAAQRVRRAREKRLRIARQETDKPSLKLRCLDAYERRCAYCERAGDDRAGWDGLSWELDRIVPGKFGGEYCASNVCLACRSCNQAKLANVTFRPPLPLSRVEAA